jgi:glutaminyl-peptide cyclotransferase
MRYQSKIRLFLAVLLLLLAAPLAAGALYLGDYRVEVTEVLPHPGPAFTQGLLYDDGLVESSGRYKGSYIQRFQPGDAEVALRHPVAPQYFAEGLTRLGDYYYLLTWKEGTMFRLRRDSLLPDGELRYPGEGWGLTTDGKSLVMSDGSDVIRFLDPTDLSIRRRIAVSYHGEPVRELNELEWVEGVIFANIWRQDVAVVIDPASGEVSARVDLAPLRAYLDNSHRVDVINGFAWRSQTRELYVTGKLWPYIFRVRLVPAGTGVTPAHPG